MDASLKINASAKLTALNTLEGSAIERPTVKVIQPYRKVKALQPPFRLNMPPERHGYIKVRRFDFL